MEEESILLPTLDRLYLLIDNRERSNPWLAGRNTHGFEQVFARKRRLETTTERQSDASPRDTPAVEVHGLADPHIP